MVRRGRATVHGIPTEGFILEYSRGRTTLMASLCGAFAAIGILMLLVGDADARIWGAVAVAFFGGGGVVLAMQVRRPGRFALTRAGLLSESRIARAFAPWDAIVDTSRTRISGQEMLTVDVTDASRIETSRGIGWLKGLNQSMGMPDFAFPTSLLGERADMLERAIRHYLEHPESRARIGRQDELDHLLREIGQSAVGVPAESVPSEPQGPMAARALLWIGGVAAVLVSLLAGLDEPDPGRERSRLIGVLLFGATGVAAVASAWLLTRRPRMARALGVLAAAGGLFLGWAITQSARGLTGALLGAVVVLMAAVVAWQLLRWRAVRPA